MQLNKSIIRGALKLSCANPNITAAVHGTIKPLLITTTNAKFSNDITVANIIHSNKVTGTHIAGNQGNAIISSDVSTGGSYVMLDRLKSTNGVFTDGVYNDCRMFYYTANSTISAGTNSTTYSLTLLDENGNTTLSKALTIPGNLTVKGWASIDGAITGGSTLTIAGAITGKSTLAITGAITGKSTLTVDGKITGKNSASITGSITASSDIHSSGGKIYTNKAAMNNDGSITGTSATISGIIKATGSNGAILAKQYIKSDSYIEADDYIVSHKYIQCISADRKSWATLNQGGSISCSDNINLGGSILTDAKNSSGSHLAAARGDNTVIRYLAEPTDGSIYVVMSSVNSPHGVFTDVQWGDTRKIHYTSNASIAANKNDYTHGVTLLDEAGHTIIKTLCVLQGSYGTSLPAITPDTKEGQVFFKII